MQKSNQISRQRLRLGKTSIENAVRSQLGCQPNNRQKSENYVL